MIFLSNKLNLLTNPDGVIFGCDLYCKSLIKTFSKIFVLITEDLSGQRRQRSQTSTSRSARDAGTQTDPSVDEYDQEVDPNEVDGLWGIRISQDKHNSSHVDWVVNRSNYMEKWKRFFDLLLGKNCKGLIN